MKISVLFKGKKILINVKETNFISKGLGLTFRTRNTRNLLFDFYGPVTWRGNLTSWFVFFPFLVLWLNKKNNVVDFRIVNPFSLSVYTKKRFFSLIEIPLNEKNEKIVKFFVGKRKI